jgi:hypothetical protein
MSPKKAALFTILALSSIMAGAVFGLLDIFGFVDGRHALSIKLLLGAAGLVYLILVTTFLLNFASRNRIYILFGFSTLFFAITFFLMNMQPLLTTIATLLYFTFLIYVYTASHNRSRMFIKFSPQELFFPILKGSFTFFLILLAVTAYIQSQKLVSHNSLISPTLIEIASKPTIKMLNQQINSQLSAGVSSKEFQSMPEDMQRRAIYKALDTTVEQMASSKSKTVYGFHPSEIPVQLARVSPSGEVDITPVIEAMLPSIAYKLNVRIQEFAVFAPFVVALLTFLLLQPLLIPLELVEGVFTLIIFRLLMRYRFIQLRKEQREVDIPSL